MKDMTPGKAVEIGSDGNVYFALMNLVSQYMADFLYLKLGIKLWSGIITEVSDKWIKVRVNRGPAAKTAIIMQYDISRVVIVTEVPVDS